MKGGYIKSLDGVRAIAILLVMSFHYEITQFGWLGVQLFFVLSGFLISGILWNEKHKPGNLSDKFKKFWVRRSLRIFPLYFAFLIFWGVGYLLFHFPAYFTIYFPYAATYTINFSRTIPGWMTNPVFTHLWSLSVEEQFYLFFPLLMFLCRPRVIKFVMVAVIFLAPVIRWLMGMYYEQRDFSSPVVADIIYWNTLSHLDAFFIGGIIPVFALQTRIKSPRKIATVAFLLVIAAGIWNFRHTLTGFHYYEDLGYSHGQTGNYEHVWHYSLLNFCFASIILAIISARDIIQKSFVTKLLESKILVNIGRVSYGMYVFHWVILIYVYSRFVTTDNYLLRVALFIPYVIIVYLLSELSYRLFELRFIKLKDKLFPDSTSTAGPKKKQVSVDEPAV